MSSPVVSFEDYPSMIEALRAIKAHLELSNATVDRLCGWTEGHCDKHLGPSCVKAFSPKNFGDMLWCLAIKGSFTIDLDKARDLEKHWERRCAANTRTVSSRISKAVKARVRPEILLEQARAGGRASGALRTGSHGSKIMRNLARTRWKKAKR
jgi:hypothetical protein